MRALAAYLSRTYFLRIGRLAGIGSQGRVGVVDGGSGRTGLELGFSSVFCTPELEHCGAVKSELTLLLQLPMEGSRQASLDKKGYG